MTNEPTQRINPEDTMKPNIPNPPPPPPSGPAIALLEIKRFLAGLALLIVFAVLATLFVWRQNTNTAADKHKAELAAETQLELARLETCTQVPEGLAVCLREDIGRRQSS